MPPLEERIADDGALVQVAIGPNPIQVAAARAAGLPVRPPELVYALIDTGAKVTCIDLKLVRALDLRRTDSVRVWTAGGVVHQDIYDIEVIMAMPRRFLIPAVIRAPALNANLSSRDFHVLPGRDVLRYCRFFDDGPAGLFRLDY
jgi:hypothetical protein